VTEEGATTAADDFRDRLQAGSRCNFVISGKLLPTDLQQLSLALHVFAYVLLARIQPLLDMTRHPEQSVLTPTITNIVNLSLTS